MDTDGGIPRKSKILITLRQCNVYMLLKWKLLIISNRFNLFNLTNSRRKRFIRSINKSGQYNFIAKFKCTGCTRSIAIFAKRVEK